MQTVAGEHIVMRPATTVGVEMKIIAFNDTAYRLWQLLQDRDFEIQDVADLIQQHYEVDAASALHDATQWVEHLCANDLLTDSSTPAPVS